MSERKPTAQIRVVFEHAVEASCFYVMAFDLLRVRGHDPMDYLGDLTRQRDRHWHAQDRSWVVLRKPLPPGFHEAIIEQIEESLNRLDKLRTKLKRDAALGGTPAPLEASTGGGPASESVPSAALASRPDGAAALGASSEPPAPPPHPGAVE